MKGTAFPQESSWTSDFFQSYQKPILWEVMFPASCRGRCCPRLGLQPLDSTSPFQQNSGSVFPGVVVRYTLDIPLSKQWAPGRQCPPMPEEII